VDWRATTAQLNLLAAAQVLVEPHAACTSSVLSLALGCCLPFWLLNPPLPPPRMLPPSQSFSWTKSLAAAAKTPRTSSPAAHGARRGRPTAQAS
jgi:hypothetical protein